MYFLIITFSIATTGLQWQEIDGEIKNIHVIYTHTLIYKSYKTAEFSNGFKKNITHSPEISIAVED